MWMYTSEERNRAIPSSQQAERMLPCGAVPFPNSSISTSERSETALDSQLMRVRSCVNDESKSATLRSDGRESQTVRSC